MSWGLAAGVGHEITARSSMPDSRPNEPLPRSDERTIREQLADYAPDPDLATRASDVGRFFAAHWSVMTPVTVLVLTVVRLLAVAHGDSDTALLILQHADTTKLLTGITMQLVLLVAPTLVVLLCWLGVLRWEALVLTFGVAAAVVPLAGLTFTALLVICVVVIRVVVPLGHALRQNPWLMRGSLAAGLVVLGYLVGNHGPWLPREVVTFERRNDETYTLDGYVLGYDQDRIVMLHADDRSVSIEDDRLLTRAPCEQVPPSAWGRTLAGIVLGWEHPHTTSARHQIRSQNETVVAIDLPSVNDRGEGMIAEGRAKATSPACPVFGQTPLATSVEGGGGACSPPGL